jgi:hypothetical protein
MNDDWTIHGLFNINDDSIIHGCFNINEDWIIHGWFNNKNDDWNIYGWFNDVPLIALVRPEWHLMEGILRIMNGGGGVKVPLDGP